MLYCNKIEIGYFDNVTMALLQCTTVTLLQCQNMMLLQRGDVTLESCNVLTLLQYHDITLIQLTHLHEYTKCMMLFQCNSNVISLLGVHLLRMETHQDQ